MKNLLEAEKFIKQAFLSDEAIFYITCKLFLWHFKTVDSVEKTFHYRAIHLLYIKKNTRRTKQSIADELFTNVKSLKAAREKYVDYFYYLYNQVKNNEITAESAITSLL